MSYFFYEAILFTSFINFTDSSIRTGDYNKQVSPEFFSTHKYKHKISSSLHCQPRTAQCCFIESKFTLLQTDMAHHSAYKGLFHIPLLYVITKLHMLFLVRFRTILDAIT